MKRLRKLAEQADRMESEGYDQMKRDEEAAVKAAILRDFGPMRSKSTSPKPEGDK